MAIAGLVPQGNPPSIAAGGYGWFDLYAVLLAPAIVRAWDRRRGVVDADEVVDPMPSVR